MLTPFHVALAVHDLATSRRFYGEILGCREGRSAKTWVDFDFFGHQLVCHLDTGARPTIHHNSVDGDRVPVPHCGVVLDFDRWRALATEVEAHGVPFVLSPRIRFAGEAGEQGTFFLRDPSGNTLEFKGFRDLSFLFATGL